MFARFSSRTLITGLLAAPAFFGASLTTSGAALAACTGPGAPTNTETKCLTAVQIPGNPLRSYDISWVNPHRAEYYLADRSNSGIDIIDTRTLTFKRTLGKGKFVGVKLNAAGTAVNNDISGPDGVVTHGRWLYAGDGDSTLKVFDLDAPDASALKQTIPTGTPSDNRVDEMALTTNGEHLLTVNNAAEPRPFANLFAANGDRGHSSVLNLSRITIDAALFPGTPAIEQPTWDPKTRRFYASVPILGKPGGCGIGVTCDGGLMVIDPATVTPGAMELGAFNPASNTGVLQLSDCGPNGATVGPHDNLLLGCTLANNPTNRSTLVINATTKHFSHVNGIVGSDEVWFNKGDGRYYTGSNRNCKSATVCSAAAADQAAVLGVIDGTSVLIETIPQSSGSHSVAADSRRNYIFVPQSAPVAVVGAGGDTTAVGAGICGSNNGCIGVYVHDVDRDRDGHDRDDHDRHERDRDGRDRDDHDHDH
jgi:hypothetical protein